MKIPDEQYLTFRMDFEVTPTWNFNKCPEEAVFIIDWWYDSPLGNNFFPVTEDPDGDKVILIIDDRGRANSVYVGSQDFEASHYFWSDELEELIELEEDEYNEMVEENRKRLTPK